jgi:hypothetical protein
VQLHSIDRRVAQRDLPTRNPDRIFAGLVHPAHREIVALDVDDDPLPPAFVQLGLRRVSGDR